MQNKPHSGTTSAAGPDPADDSPHAARLQPSNGNPHGVTGPVLFEAYRAAIAPIYDVRLPDPAAAQETTLRLHHFLPAVSNVHRFFLQPWAQKVQKESDNRLRVQIFPAMQLGGAPPQLFDQARDGVADIIWTLPGNTPGRFPRIEVVGEPQRIYSSFVHGITDLPVRIAAA